MAEVLLAEGNAPASPSVGKVSLYAKTDGFLYSQDADGTESLLSKAPVSTETRSIVVMFDGGGSVLTPGVKQAYWSPAHAGLLTGWRLLADQSGDMVIDIWRSSYDNFPPSLSDTITPSAKPTLTATAKNTSAVLTGWSTGFVTGDIFSFVIESVADVTKVTLFLLYTVS